MLFLCCLSVVASAQDEDDPHHTLDEVIVSATPLARTVEKLAQPTTVLSGSDLARKQAASPLPV